MPRIQREDGPDTWHHVMNRAIARRTMFEWREDWDCFLSLVAEAVAEGWIEVHAYTVLNTHFHLLVRSPVGELSRALRHIQLEYVRWFNRSRRRDGSLVRGRFRSKPVDSLEYRYLLVGYIDANAVEAQLAREAASYPACSAYHYVRPSGPAWLSRQWIESVVCQDLGLATYQPGRYPEVFVRGFQRAHSDLVERYVRGSGAPGPVDDLIRGTDEAVLVWMRRKAALADGTAPAMPVVAAEHVDAAIEALRRAHGGWTLGSSRSTTDGWRSVRVFLLRQLAGLRYREVARLTGLGQEGTRRLHHDVATALARDTTLSRRTREAGARSLELCYGPRRRRV